MTGSEDRFRAGQNSAAVGIGTAEPEKGREGRACAGRPHIEMHRLKRLGWGWARLEWAGLGWGWARLS